jgi:hypothetical protein
VNGKVSNTDDKNFGELKELIRSKYGSLLPHSSYDSPESLYKALEALQKHAGYSHLYNARAYKVLEAAVHSPLVFTTRDLSERSGLPLHSVSDCIYRWQKYHYKYLTRLQKKTTHGANRYKLRKRGVRTYLDWKNRIQRHNFELNRRRYSPKKVDCYFVVNKYGKFMGLTNDDLPKSL